MTTTNDPVAAIRARSGGRSVQDYFDADTRPVPEVFRSSQPGFFGTDPISKDRYLTAEWQEREMQQLWSRVWQMACHEQQILEVGDTTLYEIGDSSYLIVRVASDRIKAYYHACLHRGTKLRVDAGNVPELRCPFHAWTWDLEGRLASVPAEWDFPQLDATQLGLPEIRVATFGGFVFVCPDPGAPSFEEWLGPLPEHLASSRYEKRRLAAHLRRVVDCNWKVALEAFLEAYHVTPVHPQYSMNLSDLDTQYDVLSRYVNRMITAIGVPGPAVNYDLTEQELIETFAEVGLVGPDGAPLQVPEGMTARQVLADFMRHVWQMTTGADVSDHSDAEMLDGIAYLLFPNFQPWAGLGVPLAYRFLPYGNDPGRSVMEFFVLWPHPDTEPMPPAPPTRTLTDDDQWADVPELTWLGPVFDQDHSNLARIQAGLRTLPADGVNLAAYQESRIRHYHKILEEYLTS